MRETRLLMGMPITVEIVDAKASSKDIAHIYDFFQEIDNRFSTYKENSEISQYNRKEIDSNHVSNEMKEVFDLSEQTKQQTDGYFDIQKENGLIDPSGLVKGWAIWKASQLLAKEFRNFYIDAGGDIQVSGLNSLQKPWRVGIKNPFNQKEIVKAIMLKNNEGIATSGNYIRGQHVYNPHNKDALFSSIVSITVIGPNVYEADRFATAAFAMQEKGIQFIESLKGYEGYMIDKDGIATMTSDFEKYVC